MRTRAESAGGELSSLLQREWRHAWGWPWLPRGTDAHARDFRRSAVLILLRPDGDDASLLLVRRSPTLRYHPGQFAFPGGGLDPGEDALDAAVRECREETGLRLEPRHLVGALPPLAIGVSRNVVTPVLAWLPEGLAGVETGAPLDDETGSVHWVPSSYLTDPANRASVASDRDWRGPGFLLDDTVVWGFTGKVLTWLLDELEWSRPWDESRELRIEALDRRTG